MIEMPTIVVFIIAFLLILGGLSIATVLMILAAIVEQRSYNKTTTISFREEKHGRT